MPNMKFNKMILQRFNEMPYFDKQTLIQLSQNIKLTSIDRYIYLSLIRKDIIQLKKGYYVTNTFFAKHKDDISYLFYIANILRYPSYVSSYTALQYYDLMTDITYGTVSITNKIPRSYKNIAGDFQYHSIKNNLFKDYKLEKGNFNYFIATPSKALFDFLYFKHNQFRGLSKENVYSLIDIYRIDIEEMSIKEQKNFEILLNNHIKK